MVVDCIFYHDDAISVATPGMGGGTALTGALIKNDDGKIDADSQGRIPVLRDVVMGEFDLHTAELVTNGWWTLQPNKWPNTRRLSGYTDFVAAEVTEAGTGAGEIHPSLPQQLIVAGRFNIQMNKDMDWISSNSKVGASVANADVALMFCYSYGDNIYPYQGGRLHRIFKVADGAIGAADVFDEAWSTQLTGVTPGLDETKDYIIRGIIYDPAAKDELGIGCRVGAQKGEYKMCGFGPGNMLCRTETLFLFDGIPIHGLTGLTFEHIAGTTATPYGGLVLEEVGERSF